MIMMSISAGDDFNYDEEKEENDYDINAVE